MSNKREQIQEEAFFAAVKNQRCTLAVSMGVGKTYVGLKFLEYLYNTAEADKIMVVAPKLSIFQTWIDESLKHGVDPNLMSKIKFTTYLSLPKQDTDYDVVILDECHNLLQTHVGWLSQHGGRILGLTGTPPRYENSIKGQIVKHYCPVKYSYITNDAVDDKILNDYSIVVHMMKLNEANTIPVDTKKAKFYTSEVKNYQYWTQRIENAMSPKDKQICSVMRMRVLMNFKTKELYTKRLLQTTTDKCIVFCNTQDQADAMCKHSYHTGNPNSLDNITAFKEGSIKQMSCVLQLNEGVTIPNLKAGIILHAYGNERKSNQRIGRLLRLNPDETAQIHILCYKDTVDEKWVESALQDLDQDKISYVHAYQKSYESAL